MYMTASKYMLDLWVCEFETIILYTERPRITQEIILYTERLLPRCFEKIILYTDAWARNRPKMSNSTRQ